MPNSIILKYFANPTLFPNGVAKKAAFIAAALLLDNLISSAKRNKDDREARDKQSIVVFKLIGKVLNDVNDVADGDITIINQSGLDSNYQPSIHNVPELRNTIKAVVEGKEENTYKIKLTRKQNKQDVEHDPTTHEHVTFDVELTPVVDDTAQIVQVIENKPATKLVLSTSQIVANKINFIRIYAVNSYGRSQPSAWFSFSPKMTK